MKEGEVHMNITKEEEEMVKIEEEEDVAELEEGTLQEEEIYSQKIKEDEGEARESISYF